MSKAYPTAAEALGHEIYWPKKLEVALRHWKNRWWKGWTDRTKNDRLYALACLIDELTRADGADCVNVSNCSAYLYIEKRGRRSAEIELDANNPSVISTLHEIGHHLFGSSELRACAFSLQLFKEVFPKDFANLHADGHMMKL